MFRLTHCMVNARTVLQRRHPLETHLVFLSRTPSNCKKDECPKERPTCPPKPVPLPLCPKDDRLFWGAMAMLVMAGSFAVYAKKSPEVRDWLSMHAPWFDDFIAFAYEENMSHAQFICNSASNFKEYLLSFLDNKPKQEEIPKSCLEDEQKKSPYDVPEEPKEGEKKQIKPCEKLPPPVPVPPKPIIKKTICEVEQCVKDTGTEALENYKKAKEACICFNKLVEETMANFTLKGLEALFPAMEKRKEVVEECIEKAKHCACVMEEMIRCLDCEALAPAEERCATRQMLRDFQDKIKAASIEFAIEDNKSTLAFDEQIEKVREIINKYITEILQIFAGTKYEGRPSFKGDADLLLHHTLRYIYKLKADLDDASEGMTERVNRAMLTLDQCPEPKKARDSELQRLYRRKKAELEKMFRKRCDDQKAANDKLLKELLKKQAEKAAESLVKNLAKKEIEANALLDKMVKEKVAAEKKVFASILSQMSVKLGIVEAKLNARIKAEKETRRSQELWCAGNALLTAIKMGDPTVCVTKAIALIEKCIGDDDKLVLTVLKTIPDEVREKGIVPESVLKERYNSMEKVALRVALVEEEGASLPVYFVSYLQSLALFMKIPGIPQKEFESPPAVPDEKLDTFDLLQRARFWVQRGNIANALRYMSCLEGASAAAAASWTNAARNHVQIRQAAEAIIAHAVALALQYV